MGYAKDIYNYAKDKGYTSTQVGGASRTLILLAAGYTYDTVPPGVFAWKNLRDSVVSKLAKEEASAKDVVMKAVIKAKVQQLESHPNVDVEVIRSGNSEIVEGPALIIRKVN